MGQVDTFWLRIKEPARNEAISLSVALKRPDRSFGGTSDSRASSFTVGSARVYISVVCIRHGPPLEVEGGSCGLPLRGGPNRGVASEESRYRERRAERTT